MPVWSRVFAAAYDPFLWGAERGGMAAQRKDLLSLAHGRVIEIGAGTGLNVPHYGDAVSKVTLVEPDPLLHSRLRRRTARAALKAEIVQAGGEALPFESASFDVAVVTLVLCTVPDPKAALEEIARVLRPGGRLLFIEHVAAAPSSRLAAWQHRLHRPWHAFACGCNTNRDTLRLIADSPLSVVEVTTASWRHMPAIVKPLIIGAATAP